MINESNHGFRTHALRLDGITQQNLTPALLILFKDVIRQTCAHGLFGGDTETCLPGLVEIEDLLIRIDSKDDIGDEGKDLVRAPLRFCELLDQSVLEFNVQVTSLKRCDVVDLGVIAGIGHHEKACSLVRNSSSVMTCEKSGKMSEQKNSCSIGVRADVQSEIMVTS